MSGQELTPLGTIDVFEALAFRVGQVARQLLAEHPDLSVRDVQPRVYAHPLAEATSGALDVSPPDADGVRAWAEALGAEVDVRFHDADDVRTTFEFHQAKVTISGVEVSFSATRQPTEDEIAQWRAKRDQAVDDAAAGGGE